MKWETLAKIAAFLLIWMYIEEIYGMLYEISFNLSVIFSVWFLLFFLLQTALFLIPVAPLLHYAFKK